MHAHKEFHTPGAGLAHRLNSLGDWGLLRQMQVDVAGIRARRSKAEFRMRERRQGGHADEGRLHHCPIFLVVERTQTRRRGNGWSRCCRWRVKALGVRGVGALELLELQEWDR